MAFPWTPLGLSGPADAREVRKAYAARLKETRADTDPTGFMQLRAAYEAALARAAKASPAVPSIAPERAPVAGDAIGHEALDDEDDRRGVSIGTAIEQGAEFFLPSTPVPEPPTEPAPPLPYAAERLRVARLERRLAHAFRVWTRRHETAERRAAEVWVELALARSPHESPVAHAAGLAPPPGSSLAFLETAGHLLARRLANWPWPAGRDATDAETETGPSEGSDDAAAVPPEFVLAAAVAFGWDKYLARPGRRRAEGDAHAPVAALARARTAAEQRARWPAWLAGQGIRLPLADAGAVAVLEPGIRAEMRRAWNWLDAPGPPGFATRFFAYGNPPLEAAALLLDNADALAPGFWAKRGHAGNVAFWRRRLAVHRGLGPFGIMLTVMVAVGIGTGLMPKLVGFVQGGLAPQAMGGAITAGVGAGLLLGLVLLHPVARLVWLVRRAWIGGQAWLGRDEGRNWLRRARWGCLGGGTALCILAGLPGRSLFLWGVLTLLGLGVGGVGLTGFTENRRPAAVAGVLFAGLGVAGVVNDLLVTRTGGREWDWVGLGLLVSALALLGVLRTIVRGAARLPDWARTGLTAVVCGLWLTLLPWTARYELGIRHPEPDHPDPEAAAGLSAAQGS